MAGGIEITSTSESFDPRWGDVAGRTRRLDLVGAKRWLARAGSDGGQTLVSWCDGKEVGVFATAFQLGRLRAATPLDVRPPLDLADFSMKALDQVYGNYAATVEPAGKDRAVLVLKSPSDPDQISRITVDTARHVIVSMEERTRNKVRETVTLGDFIEAAGTWWARRMERTDADGKRVMLSTQTVKTLAPDELDGRMQAELAGRAQVQFVHLPLPSVVAAKKALAAGKGTFDDAFVMLLHYHRSQQWLRVLDHLRQAEKRAAGKPGLRWLRWAILNDSRRHEELRQAYRDEAARLAQQTSTDAYWAAEYIVGQSGSVLQANEMLALIDVLRPLYEKQPAHVHAGKRWLELRIAYLEQAGRTDEALRLRKDVAMAYGHNQGVQQQYAQALANAGDHPAAYAWLTRVLGKDAKWREEEAEALHNLYAQLLEQEGRFPALVKYLAAWTGDNPARIAAYEQYLTALIKTDQTNKAEALALRWLKEAQVPGELAPPIEARLTAAVRFLQGNGYQFATGRIEERWLVPLAQAALFFIRHPTQAATAEEIVANGQFQGTDEGRSVREAFARYLADEIAKLPGEQVQRLLRLGALR